MLDVIVGPFSLKGFEIPGVENKLITTLFADDTTVFLSQFDKFTDLESILNKWCIASGARFNVSKTEIIPICNLLYCKEVIATCHIDPSQEPLVNDIYIAQDQEPA